MTYFRSTLWTETSIRSLKGTCAKSESILSVFLPPVCTRREQMGQRKTPLVRVTIARWVQKQIWDHPCLIKFEGRKTNKVETCRQMWNFREKHFRRWWKHWLSLCGAILKWSQNGNVSTAETTTPTPRHWAELLIVSFSPNLLHLALIIVAKVISVGDVIFCAQTEICSL